MKKAILKAFFDGSTEVEEANNNNQEIINLLNKHGCNVIQTVMATDWTYFSKSKEAAENIYQHKIRDIKDSDLFVCEMSINSPTLTFEVFEALSQKKPVLLLFSKKSNSPDIVFQGNPSRLLEIEIYSSEDLESKIKKFVEKAKQKKPVSRFTIRLSEETDTYLKYLKAKMNASSKNDVIGTILENMISEDYDFLNKNT